MKVRYYTKDGCPLCDKGLAILCGFDGLDIERVDIEADAALYGEYGARIPVVQRVDDRAELGWPFEREDIERFLRA